MLSNFADATTTCCYACNAIRCVPSLRSSMQLIVGVAGLVTEVKQLKSQSFNKDDQHHESLLSEVSKVLSVNIM